MKTLLLLIVFSLLTTSSYAHETVEEFAKHWEYPYGAQDSGSTSASGGTFFSCGTRTPDSIEKVVLWYAKRLELADDHSIVTDAEEGYASLSNRKIYHFRIGSDTDKKKDNLIIMGRITSKHAHLTMVYQPNLIEKTDLCISITQTPTGSSVHVIRQEPADSPY